MRAYKTEVKLNKEQEALYKLCIAAQRFVWNLYIEENEKSDEYIGDYKFLNWFNNVYIKEHEEMSWLKKAGSKNIAHTVRMCNRTYMRAFKGIMRFPKKKSFKNFKEGYYFTRVSLKQPIKIERHKIKVPMFNWVVLKEKGYIPIHGVISGVIKKRAGRYFISVITEDEPSVSTTKCEGEGIGIDLGLKNLMSCSNGIIISNPNNLKNIQKLERKLRREQRALSRKYEAHKKDKSLTYKNFEKNQARIQKLYYRLECYREDYINKCLEIIVEHKPSFIVVENLNLEGMRKNRHLAKSMSDSKFYYIKQALIQKAKKHGIEVREVGRFYPSSKKCSKCGNIKKDLKLKDRVYKCFCGLEIDRDLNAAINLKEAKEYKILTTGGLPGSNDCGVLHQTAVDNQRIADYETGHNEAVKSQLVLKAIFDKKRNICYNYYSNIS